MVRWTILIFLLIFVLLFTGCSSKETKESASSFCSEHWVVYSQAVSENNPSLCNNILDKECKNECLYNYGYETGNKEYCQHGINPLMPEDVSKIEFCLINSALINKDISFCKEYGFDVNGFGYINYRAEEGKMICYNDRLENGKLDTHNKFCAEINPSTYCLYGFIDEEYTDCDTLEVSDYLKDACYLKFVQRFTDPQYPEFTGNLPFDCGEFKTQEGKEFCLTLKQEGYRISISLQS
ncbi:hypothetical protein JW868_00415 [Candidatus Woesearchaeota archaeon]|nr:hypothetical protein [Candidatus Woesearchaeota archaeon]